MHRHECLSATGDVGRTWRSGPCRRAGRQFHLHFIRNEPHLGLSFIARLEISEGNPQIHMAGGNEKKTEEWDDIPHERPDPRPDFSTPPPRKRLPKSLQETLDNEEKLLELVYDGQ